MSIKNTFPSSIDFKKPRGQQLAEFNLKISPNLSITSAIFLGTQLNFNKIQKRNQNKSLENSMI